MEELNFKYIHWIHVISIMSVINVYLIILTFNYLVSRDV